MKTLLIFLILSLIIISACGPLTDEQILNNPTKAIESCAKDSTDKQEGCFSHVAEIIANTSPETAYEACYNIPETEDTQNLPKFNCIQRVVDFQNTTELKLKICKKIERDDWKKDCVENVATQETDPNNIIQICNEIEDSNFRLHCYGAVNENDQNINVESQLLICDSRPDKDTCYDNLARSIINSNPEQSIEICNKITDENFKTNCLNQIMNLGDLSGENYNLAINVCSSMSSSSQSRCYTDLAKTLFSSDSKKAAVTCKKITSESNILECYKQTWFTSSALVLDNYDYTIALCNFLDSKKDDCLNAMIPIFIDESRSTARDICEFMSSSAFRECLSSVGN
nr:hypothetical protein [Nanoarchaeum sp.]